MAGNGALDLSIRIMGKVDPSLVTAIKQTKGLTGDLANALTGTKSLGSTVANTLGVIGKTGLGIMATLTTASAVMIKKTTSMAEEYQAQAADAVKYVGGIMNDDGSIDPEKRATMEDAILKMTTQVPIKRDEMAQIAASLGQSGKSYEQIFLDNQQTGEKSYLYDTARLAAAWDIDAKSAADYMAKWETAFGKTHNQIIDIADAINYLGGHMATTAAEIASVVNTSGGVGQTAGVDLHTTSALAATMLAMGVNEGKAGTSLNRVFTNITLGNSATDAQVGAWNRLGFDPVQIAKDKVGVYGRLNDDAETLLFIMQDARGVEVPSTKVNGDFEIELSALLAVSNKANISITVDPQMQALAKMVKAEVEKHNADASAHAATITAAVSAAVKNLSESGEILNEEQVKVLIKEQVDGGTGGYYGSYELTLAADGWKPARSEDDYENAGGMDYYQCIYDAELSDSASELVPVGVVSPGSFYTTTKAGVLNGCETHDGFIRFFAQRIPEADIQATVTLFGKGGGSGETGSVSIGQGLKRDASGAIAVRIGEGLDFDSANALTVRKETVMTSEDLLNEEETQQEIVDMLK